MSWRFYLSKPFCIMILRRFFFVSLLAFGLVACSTPDSRISKHRAEFDALPVETQTKIRSGKVEVGYTASMVEMALGKPDRRYTRQTEQGTSEVWAYRDRGPSLGFGFGVGGGSHSSGVGAGIGVSTRGDRSEDRLRVIVADGKVTAIESLSK